MLHEYHEIYICYDHFPQDAEMLHKILDGQTVKKAFPLVKKIVLMEETDKDFLWGTHSEKDFLWGTHSEKDFLWGTHSKVALID